MPRFTNDTFRSLNESIAAVQNPQAALDEAMEYTAILEEVILSLCEELELDPQALVEDIMTAERQKELAGKMKKQGKTTQAEYKNQQYFRKQGRVKGETRAFKKAYAKSQKLGARYNKEGESHKIYGKGGKVLKGIKTSSSKDSRDVRGRGYGAWSDIT